MSDIRCQYVTKDIAGFTVSATASAPADFTAIDPARTLVLPAGSMHYDACVSRSTGTNNTAYRDYLVSADVSASSIAFTRDTPGPTTPVRAAVQLVEYVGPPGGPNEFLRRLKQTLSMPSGLAVDESDAITGYGDITRCVPIAFCQTNRNAANFGESCIKVEIVNVSTTDVPDYRVRLTRGTTSGTVTALVYVVEFTGSNWSVQTVSHAMSASNTNEDVTIAAVNTAKTFVLRTFATTGNPPANGTVYVYPASSTTLRHRAKAITSTSVVSYVISNSQLAVQTFGTPDGTDEIATGTAGTIQTNNITVTTLASLATSAVIGQAGSSSATNVDTPAQMWGFSFLDTSTIEMRRGTPVGGTEYVVQALDFSALAAPNTGGRLNRAAGMNGGMTSLTGHMQ